MNTPTPTPRTDAAWNATFDGEQMSAGRTARALRECSQQLETELNALTAERDQLRAENERLRRAYVRPDDIRAQLESAIARAARAEAELAALRADKIRLDALDAILAENAYRARLGWRWNPEGPDSEFKIHMSRDGKMRSIRQALDVMLAARKEGSK